MKTEELYDKLKSYFCRESSPELQTLKDELIGAGVNADLAFELVDNLLRSIANGIASNVPPDDLIRYKG
jgi:hypothetical protein